MAHFRGWAWLRNTFSVTQSDPEVVECKSCKHLTGNSDALSLAWLGSISGLTPNIMECGQSEPDGSACTCPDICHIRFA